ncbi:MAG: YccF domain-containing protein [bacterium]|nr:YccF domain-containing protein [bacterium]
MSTFGNLIWLIFGGIWIFLHYLVAGVAMCLTIIGIPFGIQAIKMAQVSLWPFGKEIVDRGRGSGCLSVVMNILWFFLGGIWIALHHLVWALLLGITIVGLPWAKQHIKLAGLALMPFGKEIR